MTNVPTSTSHFLFGTKTLFLLAATLVLVVISVNGGQFLGHLESDLGAHMLVEHTVFFSIGYISLLVSERILKDLVNSTRQEPSSSHYPMRSRSIWLQTLVLAWMRLIRSFYTVTSNGLSLIICAIILVAFWHIPSIFDLASYSETIHFVQHFTFIVVGALFFLTLRQLGQSIVLFLIISSIGMMLMSGVGLSMANERVYIPYSVSSHNTAGEYMLAISIAIGVIGLPAYLIRRTFFHIGNLASNSSESN